jgi:lysophospholipase L1-like esterase
VNVSQNIEYEFLRTQAVWTPKGKRQEVYLAKHNPNNSVTMTVRVVFLGDSDISRWPPSHYPTSSVVNNNAAAAATITCVNLAKGGAVMSDLLTQLKDWREDDNNISVESNNTTLIFVACAGENDVSSGQSIDKIQHSFTSFLEELFRLNSSTDEPNINNKHLIFFGPKLEPWLTNDHTSRKQYNKLSTALQRAIRKSSVSLSHSQNIVYIDCLTMFCTLESKDVPGAVHGGRAIPDRRYFDSDELHLNDLGYVIWKEILGEKIQRII